MVVAEQLDQLIDRQIEMLDLGEVRRDVGMPVAARALGRHRIARAGDGPPALIDEVLRGRMTDAPAGTGDEHGLEHGHGALAVVHWT